MYIAAMYQVGTERLSYAGSAIDTVAFFMRLAKHELKWARSIDNQRLRKQVGLQIDEHDMTAGQMLREDIRGAYETFIEKHS